MCIYDPKTLSNYILQDPLTRMILQKPSPKDRQRQYSTYRITYTCHEFQFVTAACIVKPK